MNDKKLQYHIDGPLTIMLFGIFAVCIVLTLFAGAGAYKRINQRDSKCYNERTCLQYIATKLRTSENPDTVQVVDFGDGSALELSEKIGTREYITRIYCYEGYLMELYCLKGINVGPTAGEKMISISEVDFSLDDGMIRIELKEADGTGKKLLVSVRGRETGAA